MPIIPTVGRKSPQIRALFACIYLILTLGAVTMVYPFLLMLATSITSSTDVSEYAVLPAYLLNDNALFAKYADDKYAGELNTINTLYQTNFTKMERLTLVAGGTDENLIRVWRTFANTLPLDYKYTAFRGYGAHPAPLDVLYRAHVRSRFNNDISALNREFTEENENFETVKPPIERPYKRSWTFDPSPKTVDFIKWKAALSLEYAPVVSVDGLFARFLKEEVPAYNGDPRKAAVVWRFSRGFDEAALTATPPTNSRRRADWETFVRTKLPLRYLRPTASAAPLYRAFLHGRYPRLSALNKAYQSQFQTFDDIPLPSGPFASAAAATDWGDFVAKPMPTDMLAVDTPENRFRAAVGSAANSPNLIRPPYYAADSDYVRDNRIALRRSFITRNYRFVLGYILLHGRGILVTVVFCFAAIATTLVVNPLCAYSLSRYNLPYAYRILLFLLATMAFPAEVAMIPNFILMKQLGILNTYWALILPGAASGFSIFLLKGFFDSLPRELYEAGTIDGASEARMFLRITIPLSRPIFAVIALQAFTAAYGAFMFALLVCQNPRMWTLMVWLYELQVQFPPYIVFAGLTIAALPTLFVFLFAQNVIMRGIILPTEK